MEEREKIKLLFSLDEFERKLIYHKRKDDTDQTIYQSILFTNENNFYKRQNVIFDKLLIEGKGQDRFKKFQEVYGPLFGKLFPDEASLKRKPPEEKVEKETEKEEKEKTTPTNRPIWLLPLMACSVLGIIAAIVIWGAILLIPRLNPAQFPTQIPPTPTITIPTSTHTPLPTNTPTITDTPTTTYTPTKTYTPTFTDTPIPTPTPRITLPFSDNFNNGPSPLWEIRKGDWIVVDGQFTAKSGPAWIFLDEPTLKNYRLSVDLNVPSLGSAAATGIAIAIRVLPTQTRYFGVANQWQGETAFAYIDLGFGIEVIGGWGSGIGQNSSIEIEAVDNHFTLYIDKMKSKDLIMDGYPNGGIGIGLSCFLTCPRIDNVLLEPLH